MKSKQLEVEVEVQQQVEGGVEKEYTKAELNRLLKQDVYDLCIKRGISVTTTETKVSLVQKLLKSPKHQKEEKQPVVVENTNTSAPIAIESTTTTTTTTTTGTKWECDLPWNIVSRILLYSFKNASICTCVNSFRLRTEQLKLVDGYGYAEKSRHLDLFGHSQMNPQIKDHVLKRDGMCPMHQFNHDLGYNASITFDKDMQLKDTLPSYGDDGRLWKRSVALVSKRVFALVSDVLFTDITIRADNIDEWWNHITNNSCVIKRANTLTIGPSILPSSLFPSTNNMLLYKSAKELLFGSVDKLHIQSDQLVEKMDGLKKIATNMPQLKSIVLHCNLSKFTLKGFFTTQFTNLTSLNLYLVNVKCGGVKFDQIPTFLQPGTSITKIILPCYLDWNKLDSSVKQNLETISLRGKADFDWPSSNIITFSEIKQEDFRKLKHLHITYYDGKEGNWNDMNLPLLSVKKLTLTRCPPDVSVFIRNPQVSVVRFRNINNSNNSPFFNQSTINPETISQLLFGKTTTISSLSKIIIDSPTDIVDKDINRFKDQGYQFKGSSFSTKYSLKKLIFTNKN
ncbi:hypothetical protein DFA_11960 [Cavenderia fasciculata]|uniref:Uncharacterized protein n=1 Tax=Cavenderia fasciculata TaxID=261658 RepID=F4QEY4_CACFS|nr:uncharacterized protein DFA_11960 [Cavenderia fasciculata]EGG14191.1 hypothetical protein DFA_11960 [Cavenderia fasciculata]|eukprot:XP_004350899.1 hypothetical protein DFA_11960 [Cavenderia fasciculata]